MKALKWVLALLAISLLAACGEPDKFEGKTAREWAAEVNRQKVGKEIPATVAKPSHYMSEVQLEEKIAKASTAYLTNIEGIASGLLDAGGVDTAVVGVFAAGTRRIDARDNEEVLLGNAAAIFHHEGMERLTSRREIVKVDPIYVSGDAREEGKSRIKSVLLTWHAVSTKGEVEAIWNVARTVLRLQYDLLRTLRKYEAFFRTPYRHAAFAQISECLYWQSQIDLRVESFAAPSKKDVTRCNAEFKKFAVQAEFGTPQANDFPVRNALWVSRFLERRAADGGDDFARQMQKFALDYIK